MLVKTSLQEKIAPIFTLLITLFILSGVLFALQENTNTDSKEYGVLASQIPALKTLQSSLGVIQEDVALINKSTKNIYKTLLKNLFLTNIIEIKKSYYLRCTLGGISITKKFCKILKDNYRFAH